MKAYIRKKNSSTWHWELECPQYPENGSVILVYRKPTEGELCSLCRQIEAEGSQKAHSQELFGEDNLL